MMNTCLFRNIERAKIDFKGDIIMVPRLVSILIIILASGYWIVVSSADKFPLQLQPESFWRVNITLDVPNLIPPSVSLAIVSKDPVPAFVARIKQVRDIYKKQSPETDPIKNERLRSVEMSVNWEQAIHDVLQANERLNTLVPNGQHVSGSSGPAGKKWVVTRVVQINGKPICWYLPVEVKSGEEIKVTLTEDNAFDIGSLYDNAMQQ